VSGPSAKELLDNWRNAASADEADGWGIEIAARIEKVLARPLPTPRDERSLGRRDMLEQVLRMLNGEE